MMPNQTTGGDDSSPGFKAESPVRGRELILQIFVASQGITAGFGIINSFALVLMPSFQDEFGWEEKSNKRYLASAIFNCGAFVSSFLFVTVTGREARRRICIAHSNLIFLTGSLIAILGSLVEAPSLKESFFYLGVLIVGMAVGIHTMVVPIYLLELTTSEKKRAAPVVIWQCCLGFGVALSLLTAFVILPDVPWRAVAVVQVFICFLGLPGLYSRELPETYWLYLLRHEILEAEASMRRLFPIGDRVSKYVRKEFLRAKNYARGVTGEASNWRMWRKGGKDTVLATAILQLMSGFLVNATASYSTQTLAGGTRLLHGLSAACTILFTFVNTLLVNRFKRKHLLQAGAIYMVVTSIGAGLCDLLIKQKVGSETPVKILATFSATAFVAGYSSTWSITWLVCVEHNLRKTLEYSIAITTASFWFGNLGSSLLISRLDEAFSNHPEFSFYFFVAFISLLALVYTSMENPLKETYNVPIYNMDNILLTKGMRNDGYGPINGRTNLTNGSADSSVSEDDDVSLNRSDEYAKNFDIDHKGVNESKSMATELRLNEECNNSSSIFYFLCCDILFSPVMVWGSILPILRSLGHNRQDGEVFITFVITSLLGLFAMNILITLRYVLRPEISRGLVLWKFAICVYIVAYLATISVGYTRDRVHRIPHTICLVITVLCGVLQAAFLWSLRRHMSVEDEKLIQEEIFTDNERDVYNWEDLDLKSSKYVGQGSSGFVFEVFTTDGHVVIVKHVALDDILDRKNRLELQKLKQEAINLREVGIHPGIIRYFGSDYTKYSEPPETHYINHIIEKCDGGSFEDFLNFRMAHDSKTGIPLQEIFDFSIQITSALKFIHEKAKKVHHDLKPDNIGLKWSYNRWVTKLYDFGESERVEISTFSQNRILKGVGTAEYIAPESLLFTFNTHSRRRYMKILEKFEKLDRILALPWEFIDVYSFSMILWRLLANKRPYGGWNSGLAIEVIKGKRPHHLDTGISSSRRKLFALVKKAWGRAPSRRPKMSTIYEDLLRIRNESQQEIKREASATQYPRNEELRQRMVARQSNPEPNPEELSHILSMFRRNVAIENYAELLLEMPVTGNSIDV